MIDQGETREEDVKVKIFATVNPIGRDEYAAAGEKGMKARYMFEVFANEYTGQVRFGALDGIPDVWPENKRQDRSVRRAESREQIVGIKVSELAQELAQGLSEYSQEVADAIKKATDEVAEEAVQELKSTSPVLTGSYAKGWAKKNTYESKSSKRNTVYNKTDYQLTHLLEKGHVGRDGRRVKAIEHIRPVEEKAAAEFEDKVKGAIGR